MAEYSANAVQVVNPGESIIFTDSPVPCTRGFIRHRDDTGAFLLSGYVPNTSNCNCSCCRTNSALYLIDFGANIALNTGATTVGPISVAITLDGTTLPSSTMTVTPAAVEDYFNVSRAINAEIWRGCCQSISIRNISDQPILVQNANVIFSRPDLIISR